jgi:hypothetical protein
MSAFCAETSEEWMTNRRFLDMEALTEMLAAEEEVLPHLIAAS